MALITGLAGFSFTLAATSLLAAQSLDMGARGLALANAVVAIPSLPFEPVNPSAAIASGSPTISFTFGQAYNLSELRYATSVVAYPIGKTTAGVTLDSFGFEAYQRLTASVALSTQVAPEIRLGIRSTLRRIGITGYGSRVAHGLSVGWTAALTDRVRAGGLWRYIGAKMGYRDRLLPQELSFGFAARASPILQLLAAVAREAGAKADIRIGTEFVPVEPLWLRLGTGTNPGRISFGFGLSTDPALIDVSFSLHPTLGPSLAASVSLE